VDFFAIGLAVEVELDHIYPRRDGDLHAAVLKGVGMAKILPVNIQLRMTRRDVEQ
jgi:hypothetical protein